jgi:hypothetical protein
MAVPYQQSGACCTRVVAGKKRVGGSWRQFQWPYITTSEHERGKSPTGSRSVGNKTAIVRAKHHGCRRCQSPSIAAVMLSTALFGHGSGRGTGDGHPLQFQGSGCDSGRRRLVRPRSVLRRQELSYYARCSSSLSAFAKSYGIATFTHFDMELCLPPHGLRRNGSDNCA